MRASLILPEPGWGHVRWQELPRLRDELACDFDCSDPQLCLSGNPAQPLAGAHPERGKVSGNSAGKLCKSALREHM